MMYDLTIFFSQARLSVGLPEMWLDLRLTTGMLEKP